MHMQNMDSEAISLLKRSRAQIAREFAISLVDAPGVLEMLVAVVSVREHLATSVALKAFFV